MTTAGLLRIRVKTVLSCSKAQLRAFSVSHAGGPLRQQVAAMRASPAATTIQRPDVSKMNVQNQDEQMWKAYSTKLCQTMTGGGIKSPNSAFFAAPPNITGIPAGDGVTPAQINAGVYSIANSLLDPLSKKYSPSTEQYTQRLQRMLDYVELPHNSNAGAQLRLQSANQAAARAQAALDAVEKAARVNYDADQTVNKVPFAAWAAKHYPSYHSLNQQNMSVQTTLFSLTNQANGAGSGTLAKGRMDLGRALEGSGEAGLTMQVDDSMVDQIAALTAPPAAAGGDASAGDGSGAAPENLNLSYKPSFILDGSYSQAVKGWITKTNQAGSKPLSFTYSLEEASKTSYKQLGFKDDSSSGSAGYWFLSVNYTVDKQQQEEHISMAEASSGLQVTITATGCKGFSVHGGAWDVPSFEHDYFGKWRRDDPLTLDEAYVPTQLFFGYNVGMKIELSGDLKTKVKDSVQKALKYGGGVSFLGRPLGMGLSAGFNYNHSESSSEMLQKLGSQSSFDAIDIPGDDNMFPTLLGVLARRLPAINGKGGVAGTG